MRHMNTIESVPKPVFKDRIPFRGILLIFTLIFLFCSRQPESVFYFPETGRNALYQRSLDLQNPLRVLSIAIRPGFEDLSALAYFRLCRGATIRSAYVTNGEAIKSDIQTQLPTYLAATRRQEASKALGLLNGTVYFFNMLDIAAARDIQKVREAWPKDTLQARMIELISQFKPNIILIACNRAVGGRSPISEVLISDIVEAVKAVRPDAIRNVRERQSPSDPWEVDRILVDDASQKGYLIPRNRIHPRWKKSYYTIGQEAAQAYASMAIQRSTRMAITEPSYTIVYPPRLDKLKSLDEGLPTLPSNRLLGIQHRIRNITEKTLRGKTRNCLKDLVTVLDSVHFHIMQSYGYPMRDQKTLLEWKFGLENLRCTLVGVKVDCSISDTVFTYSQMFFFTVEAVEGLQDNGKTYIHFSGIDDWPINEELKRRFPLKIGQSYRLLTPKKIDFTIPPGQAQWKTSSVGKQLFFHIIHEGMTAEESFVYNKRIEVALGPLQVVELLTPIVRMIPEEEIVVRITNLTRDSVKDTLKIVDSLAYSEDKVFILNEKHSTSLDTIRIHWRTQPEDGTYVISLEIGGLDHFYFIARKFHAEVDRDKRIGIVPAADNSPIQDALHRLKVSYIVVELDSTFAEKIDAVDVLIIDSRVVTMSPTIHDYHEQLNRFVTQGGHLVILSQDASAWNTEPLWAGIQLTSTVLFDEDIPIEMDVNHPLFTYPNRINPEDWNGWIVRRGFNIISGSLLNETDILASTKGEDMPLIISKKEGDGNRTYIDLALDFQWMNINPGAFRLLANLISY